MTTPTAPEGSYRVGDHVIYRDHKGDKHRAVVRELAGVDRGAGQQLYIVTEDGKNVFTNERTLTPPPEDLIPWRVKAEHRYIHDLTTLDGAEEPPA